MVRVKNSYGVDKFHNFRVDTGLNDKTLAIPYEYHDTGSVKP